MAKFIINTPISTTEPTIEVTIDAASSLPRGKHRFHLIVIDDSRNVSDPDELIVQVVDADKPVARLAAPGIVNFGKSFQLDGTKSIDVGGGAIVQYQWTYLGPV